MPVSMGRLKSVKVSSTKNEPYWKGPLVDGVSVSALNRFLACPVRFAVEKIDGLVPVETYSHAIEFGNLWHSCEEATSSGVAWEPALSAEVVKLCRKFPMSQEQIIHWADVLRVQYREYVSFRKRIDDRRRGLGTVEKSVAEELKFRTEIHTSEGHDVWFNGRFDRVFLTESKGRQLVFLQENKTKNKINTESIHQQLKYDLQTMAYCYVLRKMIRAGSLGKGVSKDAALGGVRYSVIRRDCPIRRHKATAKKSEETMASFLARFRNDYVVAHPDEWFYEWDVGITDYDVDKFFRECLNPILNRVVSWYDVVTGKTQDVHGLHYVHPYGTYNVTAEGRASDVDGYVLNGNKAGLVRLKEREKFDAGID